MMIPFFGACQSVRKTFEEDVRTHIPRVNQTPGILQPEDLRALPGPVRRHLENCGFAGREKVMTAEVVYDGSSISLKPGQKLKRLKTLQFNAVGNPVRIAYMRMSMAGMIPFEGRDIYQNGQGHMWGRLAGCFTIFDDRSAQVSQSALLTVLAEALLVPGYALAPYITWHDDSDTSALAVIRHHGIEAGGVFSFNRAGEFVRFRTLDRYYAESDGSHTKYPWIVEVSDYQINSDGTRFPAEVKAMWELPSGMHEYWHGTIQQIKYNGH